MTMITQRAVLGVVLVVALAGCAENRASFFIQQINVPSSDCIVESSEDTTYRTAGLLDIAYRDNYVLTPLLHNQMSARGSAESLIAETNGILVEGANVRIWRGGRPEGDANAVYSFYQPAASYVAPESVTASGFTVVPDVAVNALLRFTYRDVDDPSQLSASELMGYQDLITVGVRMLGVTTGGVEVETPEFYFPVRICFGCLTFCPPDSIDEDSVELEYCTSREPPDSETCYFGQDNPVDCRLAVPGYGENMARAFCGL
jgi:hypothetical protein